MHSRLQVILVAIACIVAACSSSENESIPASSTTAGGVTTTTAIATTAPPTSGAPTTPSTTAGRSLGGYNVTPLRSDGQRVTFRLTVPDGAMAEVSFAPADTTILSIEPSVGLVRPNGQPGGGGSIFTAATEDAYFANYCRTALGGNCTPKTSEPITDGNRFETFTRTDGGSAARVVFGPWSMLVQDRDVANAFTFRSGPDGFPLVAPLAAGYTTKEPHLAVYIAAGPPYYMRSNPSGTCGGDTATSGVCDRGLSIDPNGLSPAPSIRRIN